MSVVPPKDYDEALDVIEALSRDLKILRQENELLKRGRFGRSSERMDPGQLGLFAGKATGPELREEASKPELGRRSKPKKAGHGRQALPEALPREVIELDLPDSDRCCSDCGKQMRLIGQDVTERGHIVPAKVVVNQYRIKKYGCPDGHQIKSASAPEGLVAGTKYEASVYASVVTSKYADHMPLNRLEGIFKRSGLHLPRQTMWDMLLRVDELVAQPILAQMHTELLREPVLHADETPVTTRLEDGKGTKTGYVWCWRSLEEPGPTKVLVDFRVSRGRDGPLDFLGSWSGTLILDGYAGYDEVIRQNGIRRAGCWAHARRKVKDAYDTGAKEAAALLRTVQLLFRLERSAKQAAAKHANPSRALLGQRERIRGRRSRRVLEILFAQAAELQDSLSVLPKSQLGKALRYLERQRPALEAFLDDPRLPIHNNDAERDLRHLAVGRRNWLVFGSQRGGDVACRLYSLVLSCKHAGIDTEAYLLDVIGRAPTTKPSAMGELTPWAWAAREAEVGLVETA